MPADFAVSCTCTRVAVLEGHTEVVHARLAGEADEAAIVAAWRGFGADLADAGLPSAPPRLIEVHDDPFRPQPRLDRDANGGMTTVVGRLRRDEGTPNGWKWVLVSHNTKMGAARGCVLVGEQLVRDGHVPAR